jgi:SulP family sulfate permease
VYEEDEEAGGSSLRRYLAAAVAAEDESGVTERTGLLSRPSGQVWYGQDEPGQGDAKQGNGFFGRLSEQMRDARQRVVKTTPKQAVTACVVEPVKLLPAVILGSLLNVLDGVSYGMIL